MGMIYVLIPLAVIGVAVAAVALVWAVRSGQFDDLDAHAWDVVLDDDEHPDAETPARNPTDHDRDDDA